MPYEAFISFIAANLEAGAVIRGGGGCRKVHWSHSGTGKCGARVIYFIAHDDVAWLLIGYTKARSDRLPASLLAELRKGMKMPSEIEKLQNDLLNSLKQMRRGQAARIAKVKLAPAAEARAKTGMSQQEFAELLGVSPRTRQGWEHGRREPLGAALHLVESRGQAPEAAART